MLRREVLLFALAVPQAVAKKVPEGAPGRDGHASQLTGSSRRNSAEIVKTR